jgi:hypothetical protein
MQRKVHNLPVLLWKIDRFRGASQSASGLSDCEGEFQSLCVNKCEGGVYGRVFLNPFLRVSFRYFK